VGDPKNWGTYLTLLESHSTSREVQMGWSITLVVIGGTPSLFTPPSNLWHHPEPSTPTSSVPSRSCVASCFPRCLNRLHWSTSLLALHLNPWLVEPYHTRSPKSLHHLTYERRKQRRRRLCLVPALACVVTATTSHIVIIAGSNGFLCLFLVISNGRRVVFIVSGFHISVKWARAHGTPYGNQIWIAQKTAKPIHRPGRWLPATAHPLVGYGPGPFGSV
jgi:hypothetical protein